MGASHAPRPPARARASPDGRRPHALTAGDALRVPPGPDEEVAAGTEEPTAQNDDWLALSSSISMLCSSAALDRSGRPKARTDDAEALMAAKSLGLVSDLASAYDFVTTFGLRGNLT